MVRKLLYLYYCPVTDLFETVSLSGFPWWAVLYIFSTYSPAASAHGSAGRIGCQYYLLRQLNCLCGTFARGSTYPGR